MKFDQHLFGKRVQERRKELGITQERLAELLYVEKQHVSRIERGINAASIDLLIDMSRILGVSIDYLLLGERTNAIHIKGKLTAIIEEISGLMRML